MDITYLHHSGFVVELKNQIFIFDPTVKIPESFFKKNKPVIICVSHSHGDHYSRSIWDYKNNNTRYIISNDIRVFNKTQKTYSISEGKSLKIDGAKITAFGSTDQGVSFLIETSEETIFFAGDLNWWAWDPKTRPHINPQVEEEDYKRILGQLKNYLQNKIIDCAFIPVDPRLDLPGGELWAAQYFIKEFKPKVLIPMHFWGDYDVINRLKNSLSKDCPTIIGTFDKQYQKVKIS